MAICKNVVYRCTHLSAAAGPRKLRLNAAAVPRVASASGRARALKAFTKNQKIVAAAPQKTMAFYETPRRNASDSTTSTRSMNRGHRREHSDPCPLPSPGLGLDVSRDERRRGGLGQRERHPPAAGDRCGRGLHWQLRAQHLCHGYVQEEKTPVRKNTKGKARGNRHLFYD